MSKKRLTISTKGLSDVVTTLIIILISLVAIGVVWVVVQNVIQEGSEQVELGQFTLDLQIKAVQVQDENVTIVIVKRNPGEGEFVGMNFIFSDGQNSEIIRENTTLQELDQRSFTITLGEINTSNLKTVSVAPIYMLSSGKETSGNLADSFDIPANKSLGTEQNREEDEEGTGTGETIGNFEKYGPVGQQLAQYTIDSSEGLLPDFTFISINPLDVQVGDNQTFTVHVSSPYNITEVVTRTQLDNELLVLPLEKISEGVYSANWTVYDTHTEVYRTNFTAKDDGGNENTVYMTWTDPCLDFNHGTTSTMDEPCTISAVDGADSSSIILSTGGSITINSGAYLAYTPGYSIIKSGGSINFPSSGGAITKQYIFYYDGDNDKYGNGTAVLSTSSSNVSGKVRGIYKLGGDTNDCNDASGSVGVCTASCSDTDGGNAPLTSGTATAYTGSCVSQACQYSQSADNCIDSVKLDESYCSGGIIVFAQHRCDQEFGNTCTAGQCGGV